MIYNQDYFPSSRTLNRNNKHELEISQSFKFKKNFNQFQSQDSSQYGSRFPPSEKPYGTNYSNYNRVGNVNASSSLAPRRRTSREITSTKEFEDRATTILTEIRRQRRTIKLESVSSSGVTSGTRSGGWREAMRNSEAMERDHAKPSPSVASSPKPSYLSQKRNSISEFVGKVIRKLSIGSKGEDCQENDKPHLVPTQFNNPLDFILMKEEFMKKNPPSPTVKAPAVPANSPESIMDSLKKMVKKINPKREFAGDKKEETVSIKRQSDWRNAQFDERMKVYAGASITPFNSHSSRWNSPGDNKMVRERIQSKVLSSVNQAQQARVNILFLSCDSFEAEQDVSVRVYPVRHWKMSALANTFIPLVLHTIEYRRTEKVDMSDIIAQFNKTEKGRKKVCHAKMLVHGLNDPKGEKYCWPLMSRSQYTWQTVKPFNVAVKMKTELFAPKSRSRATVSIDTLTCAVVTCPGTRGSTESVQRGDHDRGCALFSCVGPASNVCNAQARHVRPLVLNLPFMSLLDTDTEVNHQVFSKCDRVPQSQLVQVKYFI